MYTKVLGLAAVAGLACYHVLSAEQPALVSAPAEPPAIESEVTSTPAEPITPAVVAPAERIETQPALSAEGIALMQEYRYQLEQMREHNAQLELQLEQRESISVSTQSSYTQTEASLQNARLALQQLCGYLQTDRDFPVSGYSPLCREYWGY